MENLNIKNNVKDSELGMIKLVLKLEMELKRTDLSEDLRSGINKDITNLKNMIHSINTLHILEDLRIQEIKFT